MFVLRLVLLNELRVRSAGLVVLPSVELSRRPGGSRICTPYSPPGGHVALA